MTYLRPCLDVSYQQLLLNVVYVQLYGNMLRLVAVNY